MIDLKQFIEETVKQIIDGVVTSQEYAKVKGAYVNPAITHYAGGDLQINKETLPEPQVVEFDIALTITENKNLKGGMGIFVAGLGIGYQGKKETSGNEISRLRFSIPVILPSQNSTKTSKC